MKFYDSITPDLATWALQQPLFFTASAPLTGKHVNISPKGMPSRTFSILGPNLAAYVDATGSGSETISHVYENGRVTIMFCSFGASPRILRFFCTGRVVEWDEAEFGDLLAKMGKAKIDGARAVIVLDVWKVQTSCGYGVPRHDAGAESESEGKSQNGDEFNDRETLAQWAATKIKTGSLHSYQAEWNADSLDGLPGLNVAHRGKGDWLWAKKCKSGIRRALAQREGLVMGFILACCMILVAMVAGVSPFLNARMFGH